MTDYLNPVINLFAVDFMLVLFRHYICCICVSACFKTEEKILVSPSFLQDRVRFCVSATLTWYLRPCTLFLLKGHIFPKNIVMSLAKEP